MRVRGSIGQKMLSVLIDTSEPVLELKVSAANGEELRYKEMCKGFT